MIQYQIQYADTSGRVLAYIPDYRSVDYVIRADSAIGGCQLVLPKSYKTLFNNDNVDYRISIWRSINGAPFMLDGRTEFLTRKWTTDDNTITVFAESIQSLLMRRIVAYAANITNYSKFSGFAGNICKLLVNRNFLSGIVSSRDGASINENISEFLSVAGNYNDGVSLNIMCSRRNVYDTIISICDASIEAGLWLAAIITSNDGSWTFDTYEGQYGVNRSEVLLSPDIGNVQNVTVSYDYTEQKTFIIAAGEGKEKARLTTSAFNRTNVELSQLNRIEDFYENTQVKSATYLTQLAGRELRAKRGFRQFECELIQTPFSTRGIHYNLGDRLSVQFDNLRYNMRLDAVQITIQPDGANEKAMLRA
jgi:hypothetical protein